MSDFGEYPALEVNDVVRIVGGALRHEGAIGVVTTVCESHKPEHYRVRLDGSTGWPWFERKNLALVRPPTPDEKEAPVTESPATESPDPDFVTPELLRSLAEWIERRNPDEFKDVASGLGVLAENVEKEAKEALEESRKENERVERYARVYEAAWCEFHGESPAAESFWANEDRRMGPDAIRAGIRAVLADIEKEEEALAERSWSDLRDAPISVVKVEDRDGDLYVRDDESGEWRRVCSDGKVISMPSQRSYWGYAPYTEVKW